MSHNQKWERAWESLLDMHQHVGYLLWKYLCLRKTQGWLCAVKSCIAKCSNYSQLNMYICNTYCSLVFVWVLLYHHAQLWLSGKWNNLQNCLLHYTTKFLSLVIFVSQLKVLNSYWTTVEKWHLNSKKMRQPVVKSIL